MRSGEIIQVKRNQLSLLLVSWSGDMLAGILTLILNMFNIGFLGDQDAARSLLVAIARS
jgi:hypothetical protein